MNLYKDLWTGAHQGIAAWHFNLLVRIDTRGVMVVEQTQNQPYEPSVTMERRLRTLERGILSHSQHCLIKLMQELDGKVAESGIRSEDRQRLIKLSKEAA